MSNIIKFIDTLGLGKQVLCHHLDRRILTEIDDLTLSIQPNRVGWIGDIYPWRDAVLSRVFQSIAMYYGIRRER